jgi:hypothetical protein
MTKAAEQAVSPLAAELARIIGLSKGKRISAQELFAAAGRFDPGMVGDPAARARFHEALWELQTAGRIKLPTATSRTGWDTRAMPAIPVWVMRVDATSSEHSGKPAPRVWPSALEAAGRIAIRADEHAILERIAAWMRDNPVPVPVPVEERSLELFDDEKALDAYLKTRLFTSGTLTLSLLGCYIPPVPFVSQHVRGTGTCVLLVVENLATYTSFLEVIRELDPGSRPDLHLGWGYGGAFTQSVLSVPMLEPAPQMAFYFGDLDLAGLQIAVNAAAQATLAGLPALRPATSCYQFLLDGPRHWRRADQSNRHANPDYGAVCRWLPRSLQGQASELLRAQQRVPQERLGMEALRKVPRLLTDLASDPETLNAPDWLWKEQPASPGGDHGDRRLEAKI